MSLAKSSRDGSALARTPDVPRYALIFRTHFWDDFAQRQLDRVTAQLTAGDVFVLVDETRGKVQNIGAGRVFGLTDGQVLDAGFVAAGEGSVQWYSGDVPLYMFHQKHPDYDYYIQMEYDVNVHVDLDHMIQRLADDRVDVLIAQNKEPLAEWPWRWSCFAAYEPSEVRHGLICFSAFSGRALAILHAKRLEQASKFKAGELDDWPYCEGYIPTEAMKQGLKIADLAQYGDVAAYDWWPPYLEADLPRLQKRSFVHPVLDPDRYVPSLFKRPEGLKWLLSPTSWLHRKLLRLGARGYIKALNGPDFRKQLREGMGKRVRR